MNTNSVDLFSSPEKSTDAKGQPLAVRMRPRTLEEFVGHSHIMGPGKLLRRAIESDGLSSLILYGPPGSGKTSLAYCISSVTKSDFVTERRVEKSEPAPEPSSKILVSVTWCSTIESKS